MVSSRLTEGPWCIGYFSLSCSCSFYYWFWTLQLGRSNSDWTGPEQDRLTVTKIWYSDFKSKSVVIAPKYQFNVSLCIKSTFFLASLLKCIICYNIRIDCTSDPTLGFSAANICYFSVITKLVNSPQIFSQICYKTLSKLSPSSNTRCHNRHREVNPSHENVKTMW